MTDLCIPGVKCQCGSVYVRDEGNGYHTCLACSRFFHDTDEPSSILKAPDRRGSSIVGLMLIGWAAAIVAIMLAALWMAARVAR